MSKIHPAFLISGGTLVRSRKVFSGNRGGNKGTRPCLPPSESNSSLCPWAHLAPCRMSTEPSLFLIRSVRDDRSAIFCLLMMRHLFISSLFHLPSHPWILILSNHALNSQIEEKSTETLPKLHVILLGLIKIGKKILFDSPTLTLV
jgi:hypothetical protein